MSVSKSDHPLQSVVVAPNASQQVQAVEEVVLEKDAVSNSSAGKGVDGTVEQKKAEPGLKNYFVSSTLLACYRILLTLLSASSPMGQASMLYLSH